MVYLSKYVQRFRLERRDFSNNIPSHRIEVFPKSGNEGLYGWTYRPNDGKIHRREDLVGTIQGLRTDIHENRHTNNESETRQITEMSLEALLPLMALDDNNQYKRGVHYNNCLARKYKR